MREAAGPDGSGPNAGESAVPVVLRRGRPDDAEAILRLSLDAIRTSAAEFYSTEELAAWSGRRTVEGHRRMLEQTVLLVAEVAGELAGFANLEVETCTVDQLFVAPAAGGRGVARALLEALEQEAKAAGLTRIDAHASWRAVGVFERLGYERVVVETVALDGQRLGRVHVRRTLGR